MPPSEIAQLGPLIRYFRLAAGLSQEELAERSGISARAVSDLERGLRSSPRPESLRMLADGLALNDDERAALLVAARPELREQSTDSSHSNDPAVGRPTTLPLAARPLLIPSDALIGRDQVVEQTVALLMSERVRLVTLTGPGGVGKTRLALAVASQVSGGFVDGVAFVDLSALTHSDQVVPAITNALGIAGDPQMPSHDALLAALRERSLLLVLDTFEHLLDAALLLSELLPACPSVKILTTSRSRLRLRGEHVVPIQPLLVPASPTSESKASLNALSFNPAVRLFVDRASEAAFGFELDDQNAVAIAEICRRLDGLPLAIELAASRVGLFPPAALLEQLNLRLPALTGGTRDAPVRQRTLRDAIAWSYDLLGPSDQTVFRRLSSFAGGFSIHAAEAVAGGPGLNVPPTIEALAESNLLTLSHSAGDEPRFAMLDTIHEFAASALAQSDEAAKIQRSHADWCIKIAECAGADLRIGRNELSWYRALDAEQANLRAAIDFLLEAGDRAGVIRLLGESSYYWVNRPYPRDLRQWLDVAMQVHSKPDDDAGLSALWLLTWATAMLGDLKSAATYADRLRNLAEQVGSPLAFGLAQYTLAMIAEFNGQVEQAAVHFERAMLYFRQSGHTAAEIECMSELGGKWLLAGDVERAVAIIDESIVAARLGESDFLLGYALIIRGFAALAQDEPAPAAASFAEALVLAERLRMIRTSLTAIGGLAAVALARAQPERAARLLGAVEAARLSSGVVRIVDAASVDAISIATRKRLGQEEYNASSMEGSRMTYRRAVDDALAIGSEAAPLVMPRASS